MRSLVVIAASLAVLGTACFSSGDTEILPPSSLATPGSVPGGPPTGPDVVTVTTWTSLLGARGVKASATWAAYVDGAGAWHDLTPISAGVYAFHAPLRWSIVLACAGDEDHSIVYAFRRTATPALDVTLSDFCTPPSQPEDGAIRGTLSNVPATTTWLDFGYALDWRGTSLPVTGTSASYEIVNVAEGPWDLGFGVRDDPGLPLTRMVIRRGDVLAIDKTIDVDVAGPGSFVPGTKNVAAHGLADGDSTSFAIYYALGGPFGVAVGPQDLPDGADPSATYSTIPLEFQAPGDRYRATLVAAVRPDRPERARTITASWKDAIDVDVTLPPIYPAPTATIDAPAPYVRTTTHGAIVPGAIRYEIVVAGLGPRRATHEWRTSIDAASLDGAVLDTIPDLSGVPGWTPSWAVTNASVKIDVTAVDAPAPLGDGTIERSSMASTEIN